MPAPVLAGMGKQRRGYGEQIRHGGAKKRGAMAGGTDIFPTFAGETDSDVRFSIGFIYGICFY